MPQYALMVWGPTDYAEFDTYATAEEQAAQLAATGAFNDRLAASGRLVHVNGLTAAALGAVVDGTGAEPAVTPGPYQDAKEYINGFWVVEAADLTEAVALAAEGSRACGRIVEVRGVG